MKLKTTTMEVLSEDELENIWEAALRVWAQVPLRAPGGESFRQPLRDFGCEIDGDLVRFPQPVRDRVLGRISEQKGVSGWSSSRGRYFGTNALGSSAHPTAKALEENTTRRRLRSAARVIRVIMLYVRKTLFS